MILSPRTPITSTIWESAKKTQLVDFSAVENSQRRERSFLIMTHKMLMKNEQNYTLERDGEEEAG